MQSEFTFLVNVVARLTTTMILRLLESIFVSKQFSIAKCTKFYLDHLTFLLTWKADVTAVIRC